MDRQQKLKIALPALFVVMAIVWGPVIFGTGSKNQGNNSNSASNEVRGIGGGLDLNVLSTAGIKKKTRTTYTEWGQNPFMLKREPKAIRIEGIMWDAKNPQAIINGEMLGVGGVIEAKTIIEIKSNSVTVKDKDGNIETISQ